MRITTKAIISALALQFAMPAIADENPRQLGAHIHGHGKFNIAIEGGNLAIELEIPGMDIVGFEHEPRTKEQKEAIKMAKNSLQNKALSLFVLPEKAGCKLVSSKVGLPGHDHENDGHGEDEKHSEFHAKYEIECSAPAKLTGINFAFFKRFPKAGELEVSVIGEKNQSVHEVTRRTPMLNVLMK